MLFPYSTDVHDGKIRLAAVEIIAACFLVHLFVSGNARRVEQQVERLSLQYQSELADSLSDSVPIGMDQLAQLVERQYGGGRQGEEDDGEDVQSPTPGEQQVQQLTERFRHSVDSLRQGALWFRLSFVPAHFSALGLFTSMFVHADWMHLIFNMLFFYVCGVAMEKYWGFWRFWAVYLSCGVAAALAYMGTADAAGQGAIPIVGASGAIAGAMGAFVITHTRAKIRVFYFIGFRFGTVGVVAWVYMGIWFLSQIAWSLADRGSGVAYSAHVGGFVLGALLGWLVKSEDDASIVAQPTGRLAAGRQTGAFVSWTEPAGPPAAPRASAPSAGGYVPRPGTMAMDGVRDAHLRQVRQQVELTPAQQRAADAMGPMPQAVSLLSEGWTAYQATDYVRAARLIGRGLDHALQAGDQRRGEIADSVTALLANAQNLRFPPAQVYQWAKALSSLHLERLAAGCFDLAATTADTPQLRKHAMFSAAGVRIQGSFDLDQARAGLQRLVELDSNGVFAKQAAAMLQQMGAG